MISETLKRYAPEILTGVGIAGMAVATVLACRATPRAIDAIREAREENPVEEGSKRDVAVHVAAVVKAAAPHYAPAAVSGAAGAACVLAGAGIFRKRGAMAATACAMAERTLETYAAKVGEKLSPKKLTEIADEIATEQVEETDIPEHVAATGHGDVLCFDCASGRYFTCSSDRIRQGEAMVSKELISFGSVSLNDFYAFIGLQDISLGDDMGWCSDGPLPDFTFTSGLKDGVPFLAVRCNPTWLRSTF